MGKPRFRRVVPATYVQLLYEYLSAQGHDPQGVLGHAWPTPDPHGLGGVDVELWSGMLEAARSHLQDPLIAIHMAQTVQTRHLGVLGAVLLACDNLGQAMERFEHYQRLIFDVVQMSSQTVPGGVALRWDVHDYTPGPLVNEAGFAVMTQVARMLAQGPASPRTVSFMHARPADIRPYEDHFGCTVLFDQPEGTVTFDGALLALPLKTRDPGLIALLAKHADEQLGKLPQEDGFVEAVRREIARLITSGEPHIDHVAAKLHCPTRSLQRKLSAAGTHYRQELNLVRHELARSYLRDPRLKVVDVALLVGYSEHSAFTRAYKEWTGKSPQDERDAHFKQG